jgi:hypothetical protein
VEAVSRVHLAKGQPQRTKAIALGVVAVRRAEGVGVGSGFSDAQFGQAGAEPARAAATVRARLVPGGQVVSEPVAA